MDVIANASNNLRDTLEIPDDATEVGMEIFAPGCGD
jgi:hypothetical protein